MIFTDSSCGSMKRWMSRQRMPACTRIVRAIGENAIVPMNLLRGKTRADADTACWSHVTCHAANIALFLNRRVKFDPAKREFIGDPDANRLRSEALREPWRAI